MSQQNNTYPSFNLDGSYYGSETSQSFNDANVSHWDSQEPRTDGYAVPSPSMSVRTARSAPNSRRSFNGMSSSYPQAPQNRMDSRHLSLTHLQVPPRLPSRSSLVHADPITRFYNEEAPWSSERMFSQSNAEFVTYRDGPASEVDQLAPRSDSGYQTVPSHAHSIVSQDPKSMEQDLSPDVTYQVENMGFGSVSSEPADIVYNMAPSVTDQASQYSSRSAGRSTSHKRGIKCMDCGEISKCRSDFKKHELRHSKPYKCDVANCRRGPKGFTTINDLNRHKKSVHRIGQMDNSYQCVSETCRNKEKIWPRLDNFKQHIGRMHKDEDEQELIRRSQYHAPDPTPSEDSTSVAPMDNALAGIGTERHFSNTSNELDDPVPALSLTPDQESAGQHQWSSIDHSMYELPMDVDQNSCNNSNYGYMPCDPEPEPPVLISVTMDDKPPDLARSASFERLDVLADVADAATSRTSLDESVQPPPRLSSAPQTKADQQREDQVLKLTQMITQNLHTISNASSSTGPSDLQTAILLAVANSIGPTASSQSQSIPTRTRQSISSASNKPRKCQHPGCDVTVARACDMRKHMKRHTKPYGCTYPSCDKKFGAKSDWKRHENSQHFQLESFRCCLPSSSSLPSPSPESQPTCGELFYRKPQFLTHLRTHHSSQITTSAQLEHECRERRIGKNGQGQFWCGFCCQIVKLRKKRNDAWDERFDHIDRHFCKEGRGVEEWWCVEGRMRKGDVFREGVDEDEDEDMDDSRPISPDEVGRGGLGGGDQERGGGSQHDGYEMEEQLRLVKKAIERPSFPDVREGKRRRVYEDLSLDPSPPVQKRSRRNFNYYCCKCGDGPWATHNVISCINCDHRFCNSCNTAPMSWNET